MALTHRRQAYLIVHSMALGAALLSAHTALTAVANFERLMGSAHPYREAWMIVGTPFILFPLAAQYLIGLASGLMKGPADLSAWDGVERRAGTTETVTTTTAAGAADGSAPTVETRTATLTTTPPPPPPEPSKGDTP